MVIELLPSTRDNLLRVALLEREDYGGKNPIQISRLLCLGDDGAECTTCSTGLCRRCYQNVYPCVQPTVEGREAEFHGGRAESKSPFGTIGIASYA